MQINYEKRINPFCNHDVNIFAATVKSSNGFDFGFKLYLYV